MSDVAIGQVAAPGMKNETGDRDAIFLELFSGLVLNFFNLATVTEGRHTVRSIPHGKSATFPVVGSTTSYYHTPGQELDFSRPEHSQVIIPIRGLCVASTFLDVLEELETHYNVRSEYAKQVGESLAKEYDTAVLQNMVLAARSASNLTATHSENSGEIICGGASGGEIGADYTKLVDAFYAAAQSLDEKGVQGMGRQAFLRPLQWYSLFRSNSSSPVSDMINRDLNGEGSLANVQMPRIAGIEVVKTFNLPSDDQSSGSPNPQQPDLDIDYTDTLGVINTSDAVGAVKMMSLTSESQYDLRRQGNILLSKMAVGFGVLRPETSVEINDAGTTAANGAGFTDGSVASV